MRILFVSNFYPPLEMGGWEQLTQDMVDRLSALGHQNAVLTSHFGLRETASFDESCVHRLLHLESEDLRHYNPWAYLKKGYFERENQSSLENIVSQFQPNVIFIHSMWNLPRSTAWYAERLMPGRVIYYIASDWPYRYDIHKEFWLAGTRRPWLSNIKKLMAMIPLKLIESQHKREQLEFEHVLCVSHYIRQELATRGIVPLEHSCVTYNGIDTEIFSPHPEWNPAVWKNGAPAFLYAGSLIPAKGVHTAIRGFAKAIEEQELEGSTLTIIGSGSEEYEAQLKKLAIENGVVDRVHFRARVERSHMPDLLRQFDVLIMPSHYEALSRMMQEAMSCGLVVIGTTKWGSSELLKEGETGLTFEPEDEDGLAKKMKMVVCNPELHCKIAKTGHEVVVKQFSLVRMIDETEKHLMRVAFGD